MKRAILMLGAILLVGGCSSYYKVTDLNSGKVYYTSKLKERSSGSTTLTDAKTGSTVSITNSEVQKITKDQYDQGRFATSSGESKAPATK